MESAFPIVIDGEHSVAILHDAVVRHRVGVVMIVGGPQYRVGSHRQFLLLSRALAVAGISNLRFDYRGIGDGAGDARHFEDVEADIRSAVDNLCERTGVREVVLWGLCDAASAALMYACHDQRVVGLVLLNPWVHTREIEAKVRLKTYYLARLRSREFWTKVVRLQVDWAESAASLRHYLGGLFPARTSPRQGRATKRHYLERMRDGWSAFNRPILLIMSGEDFTAGEFRELCATDPRWRALRTGAQVQCHELPSANHTFARQEWRHEVEKLTRDWLIDLTETADT